MQLLWVNMIMDTFAALALATEPPSEALLDRKPYKKEDSMISNFMWRNILGWSICQIVVLSMMIFNVQLLWPEIETNGATYMYFPDINTVADAGS